MCITRHNKEGLTGGGGGGDEVSGGGGGPDVTVLFL